MDELIARLEAATAADFALNKDIALALGWHTTVEKHPTGTGWTAWWDEKGVIRNSLPNWVGSLDAALTLTQGHEWALWLVEEGFTARITKRSETIQETAPTAPLALCIAALKARSR